MRTADTMDTASLDGTTKRAPRRLALVVLWCRHEPSRIAEIALLPKGPKDAPLVLGRGSARADDPHERASFLRQRPGRNEVRDPLSSPGLSRVQLIVATDSAGAAVQNRGRRRLLIGGRAADGAVLAVGDTFELENEIVFQVVRRPEQLAACRHFEPKDASGFGDADAFSMVGESPACWALRDQLAFAGQRDLHVLLLGATGTGKELAARAIHRLGGSSEELVARNAATLPAGLSEAELFGNVKDYPNPGMKERRGLIGAADGSTLFLDEIGELPEDQQAQLLRVLDAGGEYHRLGEDRARRSRFRLIAATNRSVAHIKHDLLARLSLRVELPALPDRREDIPLLARHLVLGMAQKDPTIAERFVDHTPLGDYARVRPELIVLLVNAPPELGVRGLSSVLWDAAQRSDGTWLAPAPRPKTARAAEEPTTVSPARLSGEEIRAALDAHGWVVARAYRALGLRSRHVLHRLMSKHGIERE